MIVKHPSPFLGGFFQRLESLTQWHVVTLFVATTWLFGGNASWVKPYLGAWATLSLPLLIFNLRAIRRSPSHTASVSPAIRHFIYALLPLLAFNILIFISLFSPGFRIFSFEGEPIYISNRIPAWIPSAAHPAAVPIPLWLFNSFYLSAFNLLLAPQSRRSLRRFFFVLISNALLLAIFGSFQKLTGATGLFFNLVPSPQLRFFSSFIYHNHWGSFCIFMLAIALGLFTHYLHRNLLSELLRTPAMYVLVVIAALSITTPLSGSRSSTVLVLLSLLIAATHWLCIFGKRYDGPPARRPLPMLIAILAFALLVVVGYDLAKPQVEERIRNTKTDIHSVKSSALADHRFILYRDTWHMAKDRLPFGWGMASYPHTFQIYNTQAYGRADRLPLTYHDAHNDWLQTLAEFGIIGSTLIGLCAIAPFTLFRRKLRLSAVSIYLLGGCGLILLYAWLEFPFGNAAVRLIFWVLLFAAIRYAHLTYLEYKTTALTNSHTGRVPMRAP